MPRTICSTSISITALVLLCFVIVSWTDSTERNGGYSEIERIVSDRLPALRILGEVQYQITQYRLSEAGYVAAGDDAQRSLALSRNDTLAEVIGENLGRYARLISNEEERRAWQALQAKWQKYLDAHRHVIQAAESGNWTLARTNATSPDYFAQATDLIGKSIELNRNAVDTDYRAGQRSFREAKFISSVVLALGLAICTTGIGHAIFHISRPLGRITRAMKIIANGDLSQKIPEAGATGEIGEIAEALTLLRDGLIEAERLRAAQILEHQQRAGRIAHRHKVTEAFARRAQDLADTFSRLSGDVASAAKHLSATAEKTARQAHTVAGAADNASANVRAVAASAERLSISIHEINQKVADSTQVVTDASAEAAHTGVSMKLLITAAEKIGNVVELIKKIAEQTNLLALNATIEAVKAGDAGRSFAVVASEVKQLAGQTANATDEISTKVREIQTATLGTATSIEKMFSTIEVVREAAGLIALAINEQSAATREIAENTQRAASGTEGVTTNIAGVSKATNITELAAYQLTVLSSTLSGSATALQKDVFQFVIDVQRDDPLHMDLASAD